MTVRTVTFLANSIPEARNKWMRWAEARRTELFFIDGTVKRVGELVEWTVRYSNEDPAEAA